MALTAAQQAQKDIVGLDRAAASALVRERREAIAEEINAKRADLVALNDMLIGIEGTPTPAQAGTTFSIAPAEAPAS